MARGNNGQWFDWLPLAVQASALLVRPIRLQRVYTMPYAQRYQYASGTVHFALIPAVTPARFPIVIVVKISFPPMVKVGAIFSPDRLSRLGLLRQLGLESMCLSGDEEPCTCYRNDIPRSEHPIMVSSADFVSCYKGRSYTMLEEEAVMISNTESIGTAPPRNSEGASEVLPFAHCRAPSRTNGHQGFSSAPSSG